MLTPSQTHSIPLLTREGQGGGSFSPIALFVYNRSDNTRRTLRALLANTLAPKTDLYVFSDGGRDEASWADVKEVRDVLYSVEEEVTRTKGLKSMTIIERPENYYLERNILEGIAQVFQRHETIIVLEDDIVTAPHFLAYMNDAFQTYQHDGRVMHVSGFTRLDAPTAQSTYFSPFMAGWGWGTWRDRWQTHFRHYASREEAESDLTPQLASDVEYGGVFPCLKHLDRRPIPWDLCWSIAIRRHDGLCLYPAHTLVRNIGLYDGTHYGLLPAWCTRLIQSYTYDRTPSPLPVAVEPLTPQADATIETLMRRALTDWGIRYTPLGRLLRALLRRPSGS